MSAASADPGGFVVITQVSPQPNEGVQLETGRGTIAAPKNLKPQQRFYQGEPKALGVTQILTGIIQIILGIAVDVNYEHYHHTPLFVTGAPYWSGILYIISGSLSVAAANNPRIGLVRASLAMNIVSAAFAGIAIIVYALFLLFRGNPYYYWYSPCEGTAREMCLLHVQHYEITSGILYILLVFTILEFCVAISTSAFGCKTLCRTAYSEVSVVVYQTTSVNPAYPGTSAGPPLYEELKKP